MSFDSKFMNEDDSGAPGREKSEKNSKFVEENLPASRLGSQSLLPR